MRVGEKTGHETLRIRFAKMRLKTGLSVPHKDSNVLFSKLILTCLILAIGNSLSLMSVETVMLPYMNHVHFTTAADTSFFVNTEAIGLLWPAAMSIVLGHLTNRFGAALTLVYSYAVVVFGFLIVISSQSNKVTFLIGYLCLVPLSSFRIIRYAIISENVPVENRTYVMAVHTLMSPLGFLMAPITWFFIQRMRSEIVVIPSLFVFDRFTLNLLIIGFLVLGLAAVSYNLKIPFVTPIELERDAEEDQAHTQYGTILGNSHGNVQLQSELKRYRNTRFVFFTLIVFLMRFTFDMILVVYQPIMIGYYGISAHALSITYAVLGVFALLPPLIMAFLSRVMSDREILLMGFVLKVIGAVLYLPIFGRDMGIWQPIVGYILCAKGSIFCVTSLISLFTKVLGPLCSASTIGYLWSISNAVPAMAQLFFGQEIVNAYSTWRSLYYVAPTIIAFLMVITPCGWRMLDNSSAYTEQMVASAVLLKSNQAKRVV